MKNNNKVLENIPDIPCGIALMPMKEVYEQMYGDVANAQISLASATSSKEIRHILQQIYEYQVDNRVSEQIHHTVNDIKSNVQAMHKNDYTRSAMCTDLTRLLVMLDEAITMEKFNEDIEDARRTFRFMLEHAEEFVNWVYQIQQKM